MLYYYDINTVLFNVCFQARLPKNLIVISLNHALASSLLKYGGVLTFFARKYDFTDINIFLVGTFHHC